MKEKSKFIVRVILKNALEQIGVIHVMTKYSKLCKLQYYKTRSGGPSGRLWALWACLTSSFAPFGRSCRVTHADVSMMHVSVMHVSVILIVASMMHVSMVDPDTRGYNAHLILDPDTCMYDAFIYVHRALTLMHMCV